MSSRSDDIVSPSADAVTTVTNHWWWRPGWRTGRHFYACHLTLEDQPQLRELIRQCQTAIGDISYLDLIPPRWLHLTMQGIGFTDEIGSSDLTAVTEAIRNRLRDANPPTVTFHEPTIRKEAVYLKAVPKEPVYELRQSVYEAVISVLGSDRLGEAPSDPAGYAPHVSIAYVNSDGPAKPIAEALSKIESEPATVTFTTTSLVEFHRDHEMYEWTKAAPMPIGSHR